MIDPEIARYILVVCVVLGAVCSVVNCFLLISLLKR